MKLVGAGGQQTRHYGYRADGTLAAGAAQLVLPETESRSFLYVQNLSSGDLFVEFGCARAHCALTSGAVSSVTMDNVGFGFTMPPIVTFIGGLAGTASTLAIAGADTTQPVPVAAYKGSPAKGIAVLSGGTVASVTIQEGGSGYKNPPYVFIRNRREDPFGCADPSISSGSGILLPTKTSITFNGTACPTDAMAIYGATPAQAFTVMWMP